MPEADPAPRGLLGPSLLLLLLLGLSLLVRLPRYRAVDALGDLAHAPAFGLLALFVHQRLTGGKPVMRAAVSFGLAVFAGGAAELAQGVAGRQSSLHDLAADALGAAGFLAAAGAARAPSSRGRVGLLAVAMTALGLAAAPPLTTLVDVVRQSRQMPCIASFEDRLELSRWTFSESLWSLAPEHATHGRRSLRLVLLPGRYPGVSMVWPPPDWRGYGEMRFDVFLEPGPPLDLQVKVEDVGNNHEIWDRFQRSVRLRPGRERVTIPLAEMSSGPRDRTLDLSRVSRLAFYARDLSAARVLHLDDVTLVTGVSASRLILDSAPGAR